MLEPPSGELDRRLINFASRLDLQVQYDGRGLLTLSIDSKLVVFTRLARGRTVEQALQWLKSNRLNSFDDSQAYEIVVALEAEEPGAEERMIARGIKLTPLPNALAEIFGLPSAWRSTVERWVSQTLIGVQIDGRTEVAELLAVTKEGAKQASVFVDKWIGGSVSGGQGVLYLRAEAGKGKSTILADGARRHLECGAGPLPIYFPLRTLQRDVGVSWGEIASRLGVVGGSASRLALAVRSGLVVLMLDGLDEVAGRYDPTIVSAVLSVVSQELSSRESKVILSGRTTESTFLDPATALLVSIELPDPQEDEFLKYAKLVVHHTVPKWPDLAARIPDPPGGAEGLRSAEPEHWEEQRIVSWIAHVFSELGKDRSLFFVQSLACVGRTYQLAGNRPLLIESGEVAQIADASLYEVCTLAAALACVREQDKVDKIATTVFAPDAQLNCLTWLAVRAAAGEQARRSLPTPEALARTAFNLDTTHQYEEFTAVVRQMQKHALLFAGSADGLTAGDWRPQFLSEWVQGALLCRAWNSTNLPPGISRELLEEAVVTAERSRLAFQYLFADMYERDLGRRDVLFSKLRIKANADSPEAAANFWTLIAGIARLDGQVAYEPPESIPPMTDLSELTLEGADLGSEFSATLTVMAGIEFQDCTLTSCKFDQCDFSEASFVSTKLSGVVFRNCDGPLSFDACILEACEFIDTRAPSAPGVIFDGCSFDSKCRIVQNSSLSSSHTEYGPVVEFSNSYGVLACSKWQSGDWLGFDGSMDLPGYSIRGGSAKPSPLDETLRALLKPFFPRRAGTGFQLQARRYIRASAIGRGALPAGAPSSDELYSILLSEGFTDGGREGHLYAPWSSLVAVGSESLATRSRLLDYMLTGRDSEIVKRLRAKILKAARW